MNFHYQDYDTYSEETVRAFVAKLFVEMQRAQPR
jgi:hypothetical protein